MLLAVLMAAYGVAPTPWILMLPLVLLVTLFFATACAFPAALIGLWAPELTPFIMSVARATTSSRRASSRCATCTATRTTC